METVYAVHNFEAENDDELTFQIGESVIVIQKDDGFNDGWWKVLNERVCIINNKKRSIKNDGVGPKYQR